MMLTFGYIRRIVFLKISFNARNLARLIQNFTAPLVVQK